MPQKRILTPEQKEAGRLRAKAYYEANREGILAELRLNREKMEGLDTPLKQRRRAEYASKDKQVLSEARRVHRLANRDRINAEEKIRRQNTQKEHRETEKIRRQRLFGSGLCVTCCKPLLEHSRNFCEYHWFATKANAIFSRGISRVRMGQELKKILVRQDFKCRYTGVILVPGINASLDHILPRSKFPELAEDLNNLQWVAHSVNLMKRDQLEEDFLALCKLITSYNELKGNKS